MKHIVSTNQRKTFHYFLIVILFFCIQSCKSPTNPTTSNVELSVSDVSCTEAWLHLTVNNLTSNTKVQLARNSKVVNTFNITTRDTTLYDDSLSPNKTYSYQVIELQNGKTAEKSEMITAKTMDTTSNNFTFQTFTYGATNAGSSYLKDVAIIRDSNIWCVGAVYLDSANGAPDPNAYNAVHWNGSNWELKKIQFYTFCGQQQTGSYPANAVVSLEDSVVWMASINSQIAILNGGKQTKIMCVPVSVSKMWATNNNEVYTVGSIGQIGHYQNGNWQKIESGTTLQFTDIYGVTDSSIGQQQILAVCYQSIPTANRLFSIKENTATEISSDIHPQSYPILPDLYGVWFVPNRHYYVAGNGIYEKHSLSDSTWKNGRFDITEYAITEIRGNGLNDIYAVGAYGEFLHFNGVRWKSFRNDITNGIYGSVAVKGNLIVAVGENPPQAIITIAKRN